MNKEEIIEQIKQLLDKSLIIKKLESEWLDEDNGYIAKVIELEEVDKEGILYETKVDDRVSSRRYYKFNTLSFYFLRNLLNIIKNIKGNSKEEIIKEINNIIEEYGSFSSCDIDKYLIVDELLYSTCYVLSNTFYVDKVYCELLIGDNGDPEDYLYYYYKDLEDIDVLKEILEFCNIYKQQCIKDNNE